MFKAIPFLVSEVDRLIGRGLAPSVSMLVLLLCPKAGTAVMLFLRRATFFTYGVTRTVALWVGLFEGTERDRSDYF